MARESRPPGFDMSYRPEGRQSFGPPLRTWILPTIYLLGAIACVALVVSAHTQTSGWLFRYIVEGDDQRIISASWLAVLVLIGGVAAILRTGMRGVVLHPDGVESRDMTTGWPKVKNCTWAEIDEIVFEQSWIELRLWDGGQLWLPSVQDQLALRGALERIAVARGIPLKGEGLRDVEEIEAEIDERTGSV